MHCLRQLDDHREHYIIFSYSTHCLRQCHLLIAYHLSCTPPSISIWLAVFSPSRRTRPELVSSYSHRRRIWGFFIIYCRSLSAFSSIEVYLTAISRTDLCTRHSTVQYSTVHRIQYNRFGKQRLLRMTLSLLKLPCASLTPDPVSYTHTHTRPATEPSATRRHVSCHVISGQPRPRLRS